MIFKVNYYKNNWSVILNVKYAHTSADENVLYVKYMLQFCVNIITACAKRKDFNWLPVFLSVIGWKKLFWKCLQQYLSCCLRARTVLKTLSLLKSDSFTSVEIKWGKPLP